MLQIRPVSDLRNKYTEIEKIVKKNNEVYLTKNGYGTAVILSLKKYEELTNDIESKLDEADYEAAHTKRRYTHDRMFKKLKGYVHGKKN